MCGSARRLEAWPGPAGPAAASNRAGLVVSVLSVSFRHRPRALQPGPLVPSGPSGALRPLRPLHTSATFVSLWPCCRLCGPVRGAVETGVTFARAGSAPTETDIAFAGEKWAFWVRFSVAEVMVVSMVAVQG